MFWAPYVLLIIAGLFCKNSKPYDYCVIGFMGLLAWLNTSAADYSSIYLATFLNPYGASDMDFGWSLICDLGSTLGLYYNGFAGIVTVISMVLYREFGRRIGANTSFMLALFLIYPGLISLVQLRQFVACAVGCAAFAYLWTTSSKYRYVIFGILMIFSFLLHRTTIVLLFALLAFILEVSGKKGRINVGLCLVVLAAMLLMNWEALSLSIFGEIKTNTYLTTEYGTTFVSKEGGIRNALLLILTALLPYFCCRHMSFIEDALKKSFFERGLSKAVSGIFVLNLSLLVLIPVVFVTDDFMRFERYGITFALALFAMMPSLKRRSPLFSCKALYVFVCFVFAYYFVGNAFDSVYTPLLNPVKIPPFFAL